MGSNMFVTFSWTVVKEAQSTVVCLKESCAILPKKWCSSWSQLMCISLCASLPVYDSFLYWKHTHTHTHWKGFFQSRFLLLPIEDVMLFRKAAFKCFFSDPSGGGYKMIGQKSNPPSPPCHMKVCLMSVIKGLVELLHASVLLLERLYKCNLEQPSPLIRMQWGGVGRRQNLVGRGKNEGRELEVSVDFMPMVHTGSYQGRIMIFRGPKHQKYWCSWRGGSKHKKHHKIKSYLSKWNKTYGKIYLL